jgi:hypothetical protein
MISSDAVHINDNNTTLDAPQSLVNFPREDVPSVRESGYESDPVHSNFFHRPVNFPRDESPLVFDVSSASESDYESTLDEDAAESDEDDALYPDNESGRDHVFYPDFLEEDDAFWLLNFPNEKDDEEFSDDEENRSEGEFVFSDDSDSDEQADESFMQRFEQRQTSQDHLVEEKKEEQNPARPLEPIAGRIDLGHLSRKTRDAGWSVSDFSKDEFPETSEAAGPKNIGSNINTPIEFWRLLIPEAMLDDLCRYTNDYAIEWNNATPDEIHSSSNPLRNKFKKKPKWLSKWKPVTVEELKIFIALQYLMAFISLPQIKDYWDQSKEYFRIPVFSRFMSRPRFSQIKSCVHLCYFRATLINHQNDPLWKISEFLETFQRNCRFYYTCSPDLSLDEMMLRFSGRSSMKFIQQPKPTPNGFKMIALNDSKNAYTYAAILDIHLSGRSKDYYIFKLARKVGKYRTIIIDRGYATLSLVRELYEKGFYVVGTIKKYRKIPKEILEAKMLSRRRNNDEEKTDSIAVEIEEAKVNEIAFISQAGGNDVQEVINSGAVHVEENVDSGAVGMQAQATASEGEPISQTQENNQEEEPEEDAEDANASEIGTTSETQAGASCLEKGQWIWLMNRLPMILVAWYDSGICIALSSRHGPTGSTVQRREKNNFEKVVRTCPELIDYYNRKMGGVDRADALRAHLTTIRRCRKWWHSIWYWILDTALINSKILYEETLFIKRSRSDFLHDLISSLLAEGGVQRNANECKTRSMHWPSKIDNKRGHCVHCYDNNHERRYTNECCTDCNKFMHVLCFREYHEIADRDCRR